MALFPGYEAQLAEARATQQQEGAIELFCGTVKSTQAACAAKGVLHTVHTRKFDSGNTIVWEEMNPASGEPHGLLIYQNGAGLSTMALRDFLMYFAQSSRYRVLMCDNPGAGQGRICEGGIKHVLDPEVRRRFIDPFKTTEGMLDYYCKDLELVYEEAITAWGGPVHCGALSMGCIITAHFDIKHPAWFKSLSWFGMPFGKRYPKEQKTMIRELMEVLINCADPDAVAEFMVADTKKSRCGSMMLLTVQIIVD